MKPVITIIGRPNVGKSTLFNRLTRSRDAIVDDTPGVTRDRIHGQAEWGESSFLVVDTGGFISGDPDVFAPHIRNQVNQAIEESDAVIMLLDAKSGLSPYDKDLLQLLRQSSKPAFYAVNKIDGPEQESALDEFYALGIDRFYPVSAEHGYGIADLLDDLTNALPHRDDQDDQGLIKVAVVGRPNVGKSSLINRLVGSERLLVSDVAGTTRDAVDIVCRKDGAAYLLVDTAGIRRKARVRQKLEKFSIIKALKSLERCDVALIMLDASQGITDQDIKIAGYAYQRGCGCIFLANKWDLVDKQTTSVRSFSQEVYHMAKFMRFAPVLTVSALTGLRIGRIFKLIDQVWHQYTSRISTGRINRIMEKALQSTEPPLYKGRRLKFNYTAQVAIKPPTFVAFVNHPEAVHFSYQRYLLNQIREAARFDMTPVKLIFRRKTGRRNYAESKSKGSRRRKAKRR